MKKYRFLEGKKTAQAMVEFAIALPVLLLLLYGILEAGRLLFLYSTVVTASRQAARYGSTTGQGTNGVFRYQDCEGIRKAANAVGYLGAFDTISLAYDTGPGTTQTPYCSSGLNSDSSLTTALLEGNRTRLVVTVSKHFTPLVKLVPFFQRDITATSGRTILYSVPIVVEQDPNQFFKTPTILVITSDAPDPSEMNQSVAVEVWLHDENLNPISGATVNISGADVNCPITTNNNGVGSCDVVFNTVGPKVISAFYEGDANNLGSSDTEDHMVSVANTVTTILSDLPDPTVKRTDFFVSVQVTGGTTTPTGTVDVDGGGGVRCTVTLVNGAGNCGPLNYNNSGLYTLTATYNGDSNHLPSSDTEIHEVIDGTATPTLSPTATLPPTATPIPSPTPTFTPTLTPTLTPTTVPSCNLVTHGAISRSGNVMSMTTTNPYPFTITMTDITVTWNDDKGHSQGNKQLHLQRTDVGLVTIWSGDITNQSTYTIPTSATLAPGTTTISFYFDQTYDNPDGTEHIYINLRTPGCQNNPIDSSK